MARSFHSSTASSLAPSMSSNESQNSNRDPELDILEDGQDVSKVCYTGAEFEELSKDQKKKVL